MILMADHGQGRGIGGHGHMDWGERPVPFVVWGPGAVPGAINREPRSVLRARAHDLDAARRRGARACRARPSAWAALDAARGRAATARGAWPPRRASRGPVPAEPLAGELARLAAGAPSPSNRCLAIVVARNEEAAVGGVLAGLPAEACGMPVDVLLVDDGSTDATAAHRPRARRARRAATSTRAASAPRCAPDSSSPATRATPPRSTSTATASTTRPQLATRARPGRARPRRLRARLALPRPPRGHDLAPRPRQPRHDGPARHAHAHRAQRRPDRLPRVLGRRAARRPDPPRLQLRAGADAVALGRRHRAGRGADRLPPPQRAAARSCATRSTWRVWRRRSGASGAARAGCEGRQRERDAARRARTARRCRSPNSGNSSVSGPNGASGRPVTQRAVAHAHVEVEPGRRRQRQRRERAARRAACGAGPRRPAGSPAAARRAGAGAGTRSRTSSARGSAATSSCAPERGGADRRRQLDVAHARAPRRASRSRCERQSSQRPTNASRNTGAQRSRPYSRSMNSATRR